MHFPLPPLFRLEWNEAEDVAECISRTGMGSVLPGMASKSVLGGLKRPILGPYWELADMAAAASPSSVLLRPTYRLGGPARRPSAARCCLGDRDAARSPATSGGRRQSLLLLLSLAAPLATEVAVARAQDIPLFGLRKKLRKIEEGAEEIVIFIFMKAICFCLFQVAQKMVHCQNGHYQQLLP